MRRHSGTESHKGAFREAVNKSCGKEELREFVFVSRQIQIRFPSSASKCLLCPHPTVFHTGTFDRKVSVVISKKECEKLSILPSLPNDTNINTTEVSAEMLV